MHNINISMKLCDVILLNTRLSALLCNDIETASVWLRASSAGCAGFLSGNELVRDQQLQNCRCSLNRARVNKQSVQPMPKLKYNLDN